MDGMRQDVFDRLAVKCIRQERRGHAARRHS